MSDTSFTNVAVIKRLLIIRNHINNEEYDDAKEFFSEYFKLEEMDWSSKKLELNLKLVSESLSKRNFKEVVEVIDDTVDFMKATVCEYVCELNWKDLESTDNPIIKFCDFCEKNVFEVKNEEEYEMRKSNGQCIYVNYYDFGNEEFDDLLGIPRIHPKA